MEKKRQVIQAVTRRPLHQKANDYAFWQSMPPEARIAALEKIREEYNQWRYGAQSRLQRVYRIIERK
jgi:uncharacterized protein with NRDE domain